MIATFCTIFGEGKMFVTCTKQLNMILIISEGSNCPVAKSVVAGLRWTDRKCCSRAAFALASNA